MACIVVSMSPRSQAALVAPIFLFVLVHAFKVMLVDHAFEMRKLTAPALAAMTLPPYLILVLTFFLLLLLTRRPWLWMAVYLFETLLLLAHFAYFIYFKRPFYTRQFFLLFFEGAALVQSLDLPVTSKYLLAFIDVPFFVWLFAKRRAIVEGVALYRRKLAGLTLGLSVFSLAYFSWSFRLQADLFWKDLHDYKKGDRSNVTQYGLLGIDLLDAYFFRDEKTIISRFVYSPPRTHQAPRPLARKNVMCIQVESLDAEVIQRKYKGRYLAPFLQKLSHECIHYPFMMYYIKAGSTSDAEFVALNSVMPLDNFPTLKLRSYDYPNSIARKFAQAGFDIAAFHNNEQEYFNRGNAFRSMGFPTFYDRRKMNLREVGWGAPDRAVFAYVGKKMKKQSEPFFDFVVTMSTHHDFRRVRYYWTNSHFDDVPNALTRDYFNSISYVDDVLKNFVTYVRTDFPDCYIFIYGDHGPYTIPPNPDFAPTQFTPLFIITPDGRQHFETQRVASAMDLSPTLLAAAGIDFELRTEGVNLLNCPISQNAIVLPSGKQDDRRALYTKAMQNRNSSFLELRPQKIIAQACGSAAGMTGTNSLEAMYESLDKGVTLLEADFIWTSDDALVMAHDWESTMPRLYNAPARVYSVNEFRKLKMVNGLHQMTLTDLMPWLKGKPDAHIVPHIATRKLQGLQQILARHRHRFIPQAESFKEFAAIKNLGFGNVILSLGDDAPGDSEVLEFVRKNSVWAVTLSPKRAATRLPLDLKETGVFVYARGVNDEKQAEALLQNGVSGFYSDTLRH